MDDPHITFVYGDGRVVERQCSAAHAYIAAGMATARPGESAELYAEWREGQAEDTGEIDAWQDDGGAQEYEEEADSVGEDEEEDGGEAEADAEATAAIDLRETPVRRLRDALAEVTDLSVLEALASADDRGTAARHYAARISELQATDQEATEPDQSDDG